MRSSVRHAPSAGQAVLGVALLGLACSSPGASPLAALQQLRPPAAASAPLPEQPSAVTKPLAVERQTGKGREFRLEAMESTHELRPGLSVPVWGFNGQVPGPEIRVKEGEGVQIPFTNRLPVETAIHWHGLHVPNAMDGVPHVTQPPVKPGETFVYEFEARPAGSHIYHVHSHGDGARQLDMGLAGPFIVEPAIAAEVDRDYTLILDEWAVPGAGRAPSGGDDGSGMLGGMMGGGMMGGMMGGGMMGGSLFNTAAKYNVFTINGKGGPAAAPLAVRQGERVKLRLYNVGFQKHVMHLHGHRAWVTHTDGMPLPAPQEVDLVRIAPFERYDVEFVADNPGEWEIHDHNPGRSEAGLRGPGPVRGRGIGSRPGRASATQPAARRPVL